MRLVTLWAHSIITVCRLAFGRWFVFRDRPDWFVQGVAKTPIKPSDSDLTARWIEGAQYEWRMRERIRALEESASVRNASKLSTGQD